MKTEQLTFTRFIAAISIVIFHFGDSVSPFDLPIINNLVHQASISVSYFFLLSGFVMILANIKIQGSLNLTVYLRNRAIRILPLYYFALILMFVYYVIRIKVLSFPTASNPKVIDFILNIFLLQSWIPGKALTINIPAWSLSVEAFFYLIFPFLLKYFFKKATINEIVIFVLSFFALSQLLLHLLVYKYPDYTYYFINLPIFHLNEFLIGNLLGLIFVRGLIVKASKNFLYPIILLSIIILLTLNYPIKGLIYTNGLFIIFFAPLIFLIAKDNGPIAFLFRKKVMIYLGEISYGIYILQFPIYFIFTGVLTFIGYKINQPLFYLYLIVLILFSGLSFNFIERPIRLRINRSV